MSQAGSELLFPQPDVVVLLSKALSGLFELLYWLEAVAVPEFATSDTTPLEIRYCAPVPLIEIGTETLSPDMVTVLEIYSSLRVASAIDEKENISGVISATKVVTEKDSENVPTVKVAVVVVLLLDEDVSLT